MKKLLTHQIPRAIGLATGVIALLPTGAGAAADPALQEVAQGLQTTLDNVWILVAALLVLFMQAGFALVEAGLTRAKNVANVMMKNLMDLCFGALSFFAVGFAIAFGGGFDGIGRFVGGGGWFLGDGAFTYGNLTPFTFFIFQVAFAATAATIVSGAMAERTQFKSYIAYSIVVSALIYPIVVRWQWGGGWLYQLSTPFHDFAGSSIVHLTGGIAAFAGTRALGPRIGKYGADGKVNVIAGHSIPLVITGCFILLIGWFGFNPGSQLGADPVIGRIALATLLAGSAGAAVAMFTTWYRGKPDVAMAGNGLLAGLVGVTAGCYAVTTVGAVIIGAISGLLVIGSVHMFDKFKIDDPVGAISVHGVCGVFGTIAVGLFSNESSEGFISKGLFYGGGTDQLVSQIIGVLGIGAFVLVASTILFAVIKRTMGLRVSPEEELAGLDMFEHGSLGYGQDA
ncbi:MAG: ammonium transporter [Actinobacteria bacterium]|nr:ammonium transporter [Actinomycetota bacterium]MDA2951820.1 ammonium transporter [Actinomycetota bacterium]